MESVPTGLTYPGTGDQNPPFRRLRPWTPSWSRSCEATSSRRATGVHAVAVSNREIVQSAGDPGLVAFFRSSAKPIQALPVVRARPDLDDAEIAIASASHLHRPDQLEPVRSLLAKADATEDDLECGPEPTRIEHNCSGKHAAMPPALPRARMADRGIPAPVASVPAGAARRGGRRGGGRARPPCPTGVDGCGVVTYGLTLERTAHAFARIEQLDGGRRVAEAMRARPELVRGDGAPDTELMRLGRGWVAKGGAEGMLCAARDGLGLALKAEDGRTASARSALAAFLTASGTTRATWARARSRTRAARSSASCTSPARHHALTQWSSSHTVLFGLRSARFWW